MNDRKVLLEVLKIYSESIKNAATRLNDTKAGILERYAHTKDYNLRLGYLHGAKELAYVLGIIDDSERYMITQELIEKLEAE